MSTSLWLILLHSVSYIWDFCDYLVAIKGGYCLTLWSWGARFIFCFHCFVSVFLGWVGAWLWGLSPIFPWLAPSAPNSFLHHLHPFLFFLLFFSVLLFRVPDTIQNFDSLILSTIFLFFTSLILVYMSIISFFTLSFVLLYSFSNSWSWKFKFLILKKIFLRFYLFDREGERAQTGRW